MSGDTFFSYSGSSALILDCNLSSNFPPFSFSEVATDHCYTGSFYASVVPNGVVVYNFARMKGFSYVEDARHVACYSGRLLVSTSRRVSLGVDVTELVDDILSGTEQSGNSYDLRLLLAVFDQFWQKGEKENALSMLKLTKFREALPDVLSLFESLELPELPERRLTVHPGAQDLEALRALSDVLIDIGDYKNMLANTAVVELLALIGDTERMEEYLDHVLESKILDDIVKDFLAKKSARTLGYYLRAMKQYSQALEIFKNTESVEDVKNTLIANGKDFDFVASNVGWIMERKPLIAIQVFADPRVSWADALKLGTEQYKSYYLAILRVIVLRKNVTRHAELVNKYCQEMIKIFSSLSQRDFDRSSVSFCTCVMNNPESTIDDISAEMIEQIILMVTQYTSSLDGVTKSMFDTVPNPSFRISLYKAAGEPEKAIDLLWRLNHDMQECESFCQGDPNLLIYLLGLAKADTPPQDLFARITTLVTNHITTLDVSRALSFIDGDTPISLVADFIRDCYSTLHKATITAQLQASFASSDAFETDYQVAKSSLPAIELDRNSVCSICNRHLGFTSIMRTPSGALCHQKCAPRDT